MNEHKYGLFHRNKEGFFSLTAVMVFMVVSMLAIHAASRQVNHSASGLHRELLTRQAEWLAEGAAERAFARILAAGSEAAGEVRSGTLTVEPVTLTPDLEPEAMAPQRIVASYRYAVRRVGGNWRVDGTAALPIRGATLTESYSAMLTQSNGEWTAHRMD